MPNVQVRDVPPEVHAALVRRAESAGQSLQQFLRSQLEVIASTPTIDEIIDRIEARVSTASFTIEDTIDAIDAGRAGR